MDAGVRGLYVGMAVEVSGDGSSYGESKGCRLSVEQAAGDRMKLGLNRFKNPPPCETPEKCRFMSLGATSTLAYWPTVYDRNGNAEPSFDGNTTTESWKCQCGKSWTETS